MANMLKRDLEALVRRIEAADGARVASDPWRQRFHLESPVGWLNDPNGLCRWGEWYHIFYQYSPFDARGGIKLWGHYRSRDLLHFERLQPMLYPDQPWDLHGVYSGSALVEDDAMYLYYTGNVKHEGDFDYITAGRGHNTALAVSRDGVTVERKTLLLENRDYPADLTCHVRDPKVWAQDGRYYMVLGARTREDRGVLLVYESADKYRWKLQNRITTPEKFGYMWECPDLYCLDGRWFLQCSPQGVARQGDKYQNVYTCGYFPLHGDFRGACRLDAFTELDSGFDFYAPQTFLDGQRRLLIGWLGMPDAPYENPTAARGWQHCLSVPCVLERAGERVRRLPAPELKALRRGAVAPQDAQVFDLEAETELRGRLAIRDSAVVAWEQGRLTLTLTQGGYGRDTRVLEVEQVHSLRVLADTTSLEIFVNGGEGVISTRYYPNPEQRGVTVEGAAATLWEMGAITMTENWEGTTK